MIARRDGKKYTKMIHSIVRLSTHWSESDTSHFSPPSRANIKGAPNEPVDMMTSSAISSILLICWNPRFFNKQYLFVFCLSFLSEARLQMSLPLIPWLLPLEARSGLLIRFFDCQDVGHTSRYYMAVIVELNFGNFVAWQQIYSRPNYWWGFFYVR